MEYTWKDIFKNSKPHPFGDGARFAEFKFSNYVLSIVGGGIGLWGNFFTTFEIAIIDINTSNFVTDELLSEFKYGRDGDVYGDMELDQVVEILNFLNKKYGTK